MAASEIDILRDKIYARADADLRLRVEEAVNQLQVMLSGANVPNLVAFSARNMAGVQIEVQARPRDLLGVLVGLVIEARRDQLRANYVERFLAKVRETGLDI